MRQRTNGMMLGLLLMIVGTTTDPALIALAEEYQAIPGLSAKDRAVLAMNMVQQGQYRNGLVEILEAMKQLPDDEALLRLKGICETELSQPEAKDTIMKWLKLAPQTHPERAKMLALLAKSQASKEDPTEWVLVPTGEFEMGAEGAPAEADEGPKHRVSLDAFYIGKYEVTNRQYQTFVKVTGHRAPENEDPKFSIWRGGMMLDGVADLPAINVSWDDATAYCKWVGGRLPTEAEWEKAARGTDGRTYPWGNEPVSGNRANYSFDIVPIWDGIATLAKVNQYEFGRSPYGAYEMAGNVWEWVQDWYDENYYKNSTPKNPTGPANGQERVIRGGSWRNNAEKLRSPNRSKHLPVERRVYIGIRCAKDATEGKDAK
ncbi:MAG: formylglycine-generating enzyme family protein [Nitrospirota bacterium]